MLLGSCNCSCKLRMPASPAASRPPAAQPPACLPNIADRLIIRLSSSPGNAQQAPDGPLVGCFLRRVRIPSICPVALSVSVPRVLPCTVLQAHMASSSQHGLLQFLPSASVQGQGRPAQQLPEGDQREGVSPEFVYFDPRQLLDS